MSKSSSATPQPSDSALAVPPPESCGFCRLSDWRLCATFEAPPPGETDFALAPYRRSLWQCGGCGHVVNNHGFNLTALYDSAYWDRTYGGDRMAAAFDRIMALPPERSDNRARAARVDAAMSALAPAASRTLLDVGSGLAVFPAAMRARGWSCTALDPDPRGAAHARAKAGVEGVAGDFMSATPERRFGLVSFNKVLEHVPDPAAMLARARDVVETDGLVYVELPDGEAALADSPAREEFFVEHYCAFSAASLALLCRMAGFRLVLMERLIEPSGKYTLRGFLKP